METFFSTLPTFAYSTDGQSFTDIHRLIPFSFADDDIDQVAVLPADLSGQVTIRLITSGGPVNVDELFLRTLP